MELSICLLLLLATICAAGDHVSRVGNAIRSSSSGVDVPGATFLINDIVMDEGVLYAFRAYFRADKPVRFQIWRPETQNAGNGVFRLISDTRVIPSLVNEVEDIYLVSKLLGCTVVEQGDRLGLSFEEAPGAVAYTFDDTDPTAFGMTMDPTVPEPLDTVVDFDPLIFPYDFSVAAYVDTELSRYDIIDGEHLVECPSDLLIPDIDLVDDITPAPPITGAPGATGATGPSGPRGATGLQGLPGLDGATGMTGASGPQGMVGATGVMGPVGATGPSGNDGLMGETGATGPHGERGEQGLQGPPGPPGPSFEYGNNAEAVSSDDGTMFSGVMDYVLMAWLGFLTLVLIILITVCAVVLKRRSHPTSVSKVIERLPTRPGMEWVAKQNRKSSVGGPMMWNAAGGEVPYNSDHIERGAVISGIEGDEEWMGTLKSTTETCYSNETLNMVDETSSAGSAGSDTISVTVSDSPMIA